MPLTLSQAAEIAKAATSAGGAAGAQAVKNRGERALATQHAEESERQAKLKNYLQGHLEQGRQEQGKKLLNDPDVQNVVNDGGSYSVDPATGAVHIGGNPYAKMAGQGPHEAQSFLKNAQGLYKGINDQLDGAKGTVDALNQGNAISDKVALMNETKLGLGGSGGKAFGAVMAQLSGDPTMAQDSQKALNWLQNSPNVPTMQPAMRDAIREDVYRRIPLIQKQHEQASQQLMQQGPAVAPHADYNTIVQSFTSPTMQKLQDLQGMQKQYAAQRQQMQPQPGVSQPAQANANPTTLDKLRSFFGGGSSQQQAPQSAASPADDPAFQRYQQLLQKSGMGQ